MNLAMRLRVSRGNRQTEIDAQPAVNAVPAGIHAPFHLARRVLVSRFLP